MREYNARGARRAVARATRMDAPLLVQLFERAAEVLRLVLLREAFLRERGRWKGGETVDRGACFVRGARGEARTPGAASSATRREAYPRGDGIRRHLRTRAGPGAGSEEECTRPSEDVMFSRRSWRKSERVVGARHFHAVTSGREGSAGDEIERAARTARRASPTRGFGTRTPRTRPPSAAFLALSLGTRDERRVRARSRRRSRARARDLPRHPSSRPSSRLRPHPRGPRLALALITSLLPRVSSRSAAAHRVARA